MSFRQWCTEKWYEHRDEFESWFKRQPDYSAQEYFATYKYWLKREYRYQNAKTH